ncbi:MAG: FmdB family zinc ribbon protein [Lentisphaeria bacterium]|nr:FmdB family zinc ribbon protein [Lentisphaeria bacterium]
MPHYDYVCMDCGDTFEAFQTMAAEPLTTCEKCSGKLKRLIGTGAGFVFKGTPVSETDYRLTKSYKEGEKKDTPSNASTPSKTDTKPAAKAATKAE